MAESYIAELGYKVDTRPLKQGEKALDNVATAGKKAETGIQSLTSTVGVLSAGLAALAANAVIRDVINYSDSWARVDNSLRLVISSEDELISKREMLIALSKETNANLGSTVALYAELYRNTRELGTSEETVATVTRTLNNLFVSGGKDAQTQAGAIRQLSQALGAGALRGDEFNSVAEAAPRILDAISESTGLAKGELRDFAATGGITAEILVTAINSYASEAQRLADATTKTFEQSMENVTTNVTAYVGAAESIQDATMALGETLETVSENIDGVVNGVKAAGSVMLIAAVPSVVKYTASLYANVTAQLLANTQAVRTVSALGSVTVAAGTATVATNALNIATKALLSPWALVITAIGAGAAAYALTDEKASDYNNTLGDQKDLLDEVTKRVKMLSDFQKADVALDARLKLNENLEKQSALQEQINLDQFDSGAIASLTLKKQEALNKLKAEEVRLNGIITAANETPETEEGGSVGGDNSQLESLRQMQKEIGMSKDELFVFRQEQKSIANEDAPEMTAAIVAMAQALVDQRNKVEATKAAFKDLFGMDTVDTYALQQSKDYDTWIASISTTSTQMQDLRDEIIKTQEAINGGDLDPDIGKEYIDGLNSQLNRLDVSAFDSITTSTQDGLASIQSMSAQGSKEYQRLGVAIQAVNAIQAIAAVLNQAGGDPYTAFARMAAMAASVASLGFSVGSISGGGFDDVAAERQETQGTTIWGEKSESIANATEITASAVEDLVGINTDMLSALTSVSDGISKASALIGRDVNTPEINQSDLVFDYNDVMGIFEPLGIEKIFMDPLGLFGKAFNKIFGGSSKVVDEGIQIVGGTLGEMIDNISVQAFQSVQYKKWKFGSKKNKTVYDDITNDVGSQLQLVLDSIADSVFAGAEMLGMNTAEIEEAIQNFEIETIKISLKGLNAEEQQAEIEAVFSSIFDDLSAEVVPFLDQFQEVGEGLGETLARVATQVNVMDLVVDQLGVTMFDKFSNPELYAKAADNLSTLVGGIEEFASKTSSFVNSFAPDAVKLEIYGDSISESLSAVGLSVPETAAGFWDLMNGLDASTESGREQIAALLNSQGVAEEYYNLLEDSQDAIKEAAQSYRTAIDNMYDVTEEAATANLDAALDAARKGDLSLAGELDLSTVAPDMNNYSSMLEYDLARSEASAKLEELAKLTEGTITVDEKQLEALEQIRDSLDALSEESNSSTAMELKKEFETLNTMQKSQARTSADSNAILQQMLVDGLPVRIES